MKLTDKEKAILQGEQGEGLQKALDYIVQLGEAFDAEKLVDITYCHYLAEMSIYKGDIDILEDISKYGLKAVVPTTTSTLCYDLDDTKLTGIPEELAIEQYKVVDLHRKMNIEPTYTCTPYLLGYIPATGSYIASAESSAIIWFNSVLGAKTNRGGIFTKFSALTGKTPYMGYLMDENRKGTHLFNINLRLKNLKSEMDWSLLGFHIGKIVGSEIPVLVLPDEFKGTIKQEWLIALGAALATSGSVAMFHIVGITPEAPSLKAAFQGTKPKITLNVNEKDLKEAWEENNTSKSTTVDFILLGCPHYSYHQLKYLAGLLEGKKIKDSVQFWITTMRGIKMQAKWSGLLDIIEKSGAKVISDTCAVESHMRVSTCRQFGLKVPQFNVMLTDSVKQARYVKDLIGSEVRLADIHSCVNAAITGEIKI